MFSFLNKSKNSITFYFWSFIFILGISILGSIYFHSYAPYVFPIIAIGFGLIYDDFTRLFYFIFAILPFSVEIYFDGVGLGTDLPSEPMMLFLSGCTFIYLIKKRMSFPIQYLTHPIFLLLIIHLFWVFITAINSQNLLISFKLFAAKIWYFLPFYILPLLFVKEKNQLVKAYKILYAFLFISISIVLVRHAFEGFSFKPRPDNDTRG